MIQRWMIIVLFFITSSFSLARDSLLKLNDIYLKNTFYPETLEEIYSMNNGRSYTVLEDGKKIVKYAYRKAGKRKVLLDLTEKKGFSHRVFHYSFSHDESMILLAAEKEPVYRRSYKARFFVFHREKEEITPLTPAGKQQLAAFSPDGRYVSFVRDNNMYLKHLRTGKIRAITTDGEKNHIINGAPDWVYEEEFGFARGYQWSPDGSALAYYKFDESRVKQYPLTIYKDDYPEISYYKYPKAGEKNSLVSVYVYHPANDTTVEVDTGKDTSWYLPRIKWMKKDNKLCVFRLNRRQDTLQLLNANIKNGNTHLFFTETEDQYIAEPTYDHITFLSEGKGFLILSEKDSYRHIYHYNLKGDLVNQLTHGKWDVSRLLGYDADSRMVYYESAEVSPLENHIYKVSLAGEAKKRLSREPGCHSAEFSSNYDYYVGRYSSANQPDEYSVYDQEGGLIRILEDNGELKEKIEESDFVQKKFMKIPLEEGLQLNAFMMKPADFNPEKEYPLVVYVYGGPGSQTVRNAWSHYMPFFQYLNQKGYVVVSVDNRGTSGRGEVFRKSTYMQLGKKEISDQLEAIRYLGRLSYLDSSRMGMFGWSYGGFMTCLGMTKSDGLLKAGVAVAPVTNWRFYDTIYTERFMKTPDENTEGYDSNSPIHYADNLKGKLLLIHGTADDNVHMQNTLEFADALIKAGKDVEMMIYPDKNHAIPGSRHQYHVFSGIADFFLENL